MAEEHENDEPQVEDDRQLIASWEGKEPPQGAAEYYPVDEAPAVALAEGAIENEHQLEAARQQIAYWRSTISSAQSWLGNEQARAEIARLKQRIREYEKRLSAG